MGVVDRWSLDPEPIGSLELPFAIAELLAPAREIANPRRAPLALQSVLRHGADPTGRHDSLSAFNAAFLALPPTGGWIEVPRGQYRLSAPLLWRNKPVHLSGAGAAATCLRIAHNGWAIDYAAMSRRAAGPTLQVSDLAVRCICEQPAAGAVRARFGREPGGVRLTGLRLAGGGTPMRGGIWLENACDSHVGDVTLCGNRYGAFVTLAAAAKAILLDGIRHDGTGPSVAFVQDDVPMAATPFSGIDIVRPEFRTDRIAIEAVPGHGDGIKLRGLFLGDGLIAAPATCLALDAVADALISNTRFVASAPGSDPLLRVTRSHDVRVSDCRFENPCPSRGAAQIDGCDNLLLG